MKNLIKVLSLCLFVFLGSCSKDSTGIEEKEPNVYVLNTILSNTTNQGYVQIWNNGKTTDLTDKSNDAKGYRMYVSNSDTYVLGGEYDTATGHEGQRLWKNGERLITPANTTYVDVFVSGSDVYFLGTERLASKVSKVGVNNKVVVYKNGKPTYLTDGSTYTDPHRIFVVGSDVYFLGKGYDELTEKGILKLWKNGEVTNITDGTIDAVATDLFVTQNNDVYVLGREYDGNHYTSKLWKNGSEVVNFINEPSFRAISVFVSNEIVYVVGYKLEAGKYKTQLWKNDQVSVDIGVGAVDSFPTDVFVKDGKVYISFSETNQDGIYVSKIWVDGVITELTDGKTDAYSEGIFVE